MKRARKPAAVAKQPTRVVRASVSLKRDLYETLESLARQKKVSTAWVLRDAAEKYVEEQVPALNKTDPES